MTRWLAALVLVAGCSQAAPEQTPQGVTLLAMDRLDIADGRGLYVGLRDQREVRVAFAVPLDRVDPQRGHGSERVGMSDDGDAVVLIDRYATRVNGDADPCAIGFEAWLRVFALDAAKELLAVPIESCRDGLPRLEPAATWLGGDRFRIETAGTPVYVLEGGGVRRL